MRPELQRYQFYILLALFLLTLLLSTSSRASVVEAQESGVQTEAVVETIFNQMTPQERVGQLFVVSFEGRDISFDSNIARLIQTYRIGGVVISPENRNFINNAAASAQVLNLTNGLQALARETPAPTAAALEASPSPPPITSPVAAQAVLTTTTESYTPLPLFIAVQQEGDGYPFTEIRGPDLTAIPSPMALGATWNTEYARAVGEVVGRELLLLGVNMLFGPSLDVLDEPRAERSGSLGIRTFGGHPFWVSEMGQAYIVGVHHGSNHQVLTIAKHFPGFGSSDREIDQGVPTIIKSLSDLRQTELPPFFRITALDPDDPDNLEGVTDGLMTAHIRYQGLPGNVPLSLDARNLPTLLALKEIAPWREAGGLVVSAPLGVPAALEGLAAGQENFPARRLAQDALLAGSDILLVADFALTDDPATEFMNITDAIDFFAERYRNDPNFQAVVDRAVRNVLKAKVKIYGPDLLTRNIQRPPGNLELLDEVTIDTSQIAQAGVTLITPITRDGLSPLPGPPQPDEDILIFVDDRLGRDCPGCPEFPLIEPTALEEIILRLFGPEATGQISPEQITSLGFSDLKEALSEQPSGNDSYPETLIENAEWLIFAMLDIDPEVYPHSDAVKVLLRNRYEALRNKNLVLFAFNAPYFLDETEISQLTAYYGFYSKEAAYLETAARLLFQQFEPGGASPVGIPAIGPLDLSPDLNQTIQLEPVQWIDAGGNSHPIEEKTQATNRLDLEVGEGVLFRTSVIVDKNGNPVPDGTVVDFFRVYPQERLPLEPITRQTTDGVAEVQIFKERDTPLQVRVSAAQAVPFDIGPGIVETPTPTPTATPPPTATPIPTRTTAPTGTPTTGAPDSTPAPTPTRPPLEVNSGRTSGPVDFVDLVYSLVGLLVIGGIGFTLGGDRFSLEERIRPALVAVAFGLVGYVSYTIAAMAFPESVYITALLERNAGGHWLVPLISLLFAVIGVVAWYLKPGRIFWLKDRPLNLETSEKDQ